MNQFLNSTLIKIFNKKNLILFLAILVLGTVLPLQFSSAGYFTDKIVATLLFLPFVIVYIFYFLSSLLPIITGSLLKWVINLDILLTRCDIPGTCAVDIGWQFTRDLANIFFILFLVIIAFATILKIESYGMRRLLPILIIVALLINFSQLFVGIIVDFWNALTGFFTSKLTNIGDYWGEVTQTTGENWDSAFSGRTESAFSNMGDVIELLIMGIFNLILGFMLGFYFLIFFMRIPMLWMLTILAPVYFVCAILPYTKGKFDQWIKWVLEWASIGFWAALFLYLGLFVIRGTKAMGLDKTSYTMAGGENITGGLEGLIQGVLPYLVAIAFLALGAMTAFETNSLFSGAIVGGAKDMYGKYVSPQAFGKRATGKAKEYVGKPLKEGAEKVKEAGKLGFLQGAAKIPTVKTKVAYEEEKRKQNEKKSKKIEELSSNYEKYSPETQALIAGKKHIIPGTAKKEASALAMAAARKGKGAEISKSMKEGEWEKVVEKGSLNLREVDKKKYKEMLKNAPQYAQADPNAEEGVGTSKEAQIIEAYGNVPPSFWKEESNKESFEFLEKNKENIGEKVVGNFSVEKLKNFAKIQKERVRENAQKTIGNLLERRGNNLNDPVKVYLTEDKMGKAWKGYVDLKNIQSPSPDDKKGGKGKEDKTTQTTLDKW